MQSDARLRTGLKISALPDRQSSPPGTGAGGKALALLPLPGQKGAGPAPHMGERARAEPGTAAGMAPEMG